MKIWFAPLLALAAASFAEEPAPPEPAPPPVSAPVSLVEPLRELLAQLNPMERSRFFDRHPGLKKAVGWREPAPAGRMISSSRAESDPSLRAEQERERREVEYHIRSAEPPSPSASAPEAALSAPRESEADRLKLQRESERKVQELIEQMDGGFPKQEDY